MISSEYGRAYGREMMTLGIYRLEVLGEDLIKLAGVVKVLILPMIFL
jgi:hypothetical protein